MTARNRPSTLSTHYGPLEVLVMEHVWQSAPMDVRAVQSALAHDGQQAAYSTVKTIMERLVIKGELTRERQGKQFVYAAVRNRAETEALVTQGMVDDLLDRHGDLAVSFFVDRARQDPIQLERLRRLLRDMEVEGGGVDG